MKLVTAVLGAILLHSSGGGAGQSDLLYGEIAQRWLDRNGIQSPGAWPEILETRFTHVGLGVFDVYLPTASVRDARLWKPTGAALQALIDCQEGWAGWASARAERAPDAEAITKWLRGLQPKQLTARPPEGADLADLAGADDGMRTRLAHYREEMRSGKPLGADHTLEGVRLVVFPQRGEFVEFTCLAGSLEDRLKATAWNDGLTTWLEYQAGDVRFMTLEYASSEAARDFDKGISVGERNPAALGQLVSQVACRSLLARLCPELDPALSSGLANSLVIDLFDELDTRVDGDVRSRSTQGKSVFIPGGNPNGGFLPPTSAENRWRGTKGKDHFVSVLARVQKQSGRKALSRSEKLTRFELQSDSGSQKEIVNAPFLGPRAVRPGDGVFPDYLELVRCYGVAFLHWLRIEGAPKGADASAPLFASFLQALAGGANADDLPQVLEKIYGQPLSADDPEGLFERPSLEGRFLTWLSRQG